MEALNRLSTMLTDSVEFLALSVLIAGASVAVGAWRRSIGYFFASVITGTVVGYVVSQTPMIATFSHVAAAMGAGIGAATLAYVSDKDILKLFKEYLTIKKSSSGSGTIQIDRDTSPETVFKTDD